MDCSLGIVPGGGDLTWSDNQSVTSDESSCLVMPTSPLWTNAIPAPRTHNGQLSPVSSDQGSIAPLARSAVPSMSHSRTSSTADSWTTGTSYNESEMEAPDGDDPAWEQTSTETLTIPKLEPAEDDDFHMNDVQEAPRPLDFDSMKAPPPPPLIKTKRPRGRPRKHPLTHQVTASKVAKGRSKTGCITCRKRKKKCDEAKPRCMNCEKNAVVCEGYHEKTIWKSGREKAEEERQKCSLPNITLQPIFQGVETPEDMVFLNHYINRLSGVLTVEGQHKNAFKDILLQMAVEHRGLMHSILSLASRHIDYEAPYGMKLLHSNPKISFDSLTARSQYHHDLAMEKLCEPLGGEDEPGYNASLSSRYGQMLCFLLQTMAEGNPNGDHRVHLQAYKNLIQQTPPPDSALLTFITEFFQYRVFADELIRYPDPATPASANTRLATEDWEPWVPIEPARLIGVADGLFHTLAQITTVRNAIRVNIANKIDPAVDYASLYRAAEIDASIRAWAPRWPPGDTRDRVGRLYQQILWVYLFRTIYPPVAPTSTSQQRGQAPTAAAAADDSSAPEKTSPPAGSPTTTSTASTGHQHHHRDDSRITVAVDESLDLLESFAAADPVQTLLLVPCLVIGCASFAPGQRARVRAALAVVRGYTGMRNGDRVGEVLDEVWRLMDRGEWARVWDWQAVARGMGLDFSCA